ncbi:4-hydroxy-tetrahydrodipicolinate synthase [Ornithinimicrobium sp. Arc0846-15]|nr:4-hydroxy-tetrahydrodipicolinate synthase [Ornithinimicrobium laminariae]
MSSLFTGLGVALATPFADFSLSAGAAAKSASGRMPQPPLDLSAWERLVRHVIDGGADYVIVLGSTGEAATIIDAERTQLITAAVALAAPTNTPVVVGVGHNDTERTCDLAEAALEAGADGILVVAPFYNKPQQAGIVAHFAAVAQCVPQMPIIAYNVPSRTGTNITPATMQQIWAITTVVALKESSGDMGQMVTLIQEAPDGCAVLSGEDNLALPAIAVGARGLVSVCGNVAPTHTAGLVHAAMADDLRTARQYARSLAPLMGAMFVETNPVPVKAAIASLGLASSAVRMPLVKAQMDTWRQVHLALAGLNLHRMAPVSVRPSTPSTASAQPTAGVRV